MKVILVDQSMANLASNNSRQIYSQISGLNIYQNDDAGIQLHIGGRGLDPNRTSNFNTRQSSKAAVEHHYDIGSADFYKLFIDEKHFQYSCGYWPKKDMTLEDSQEAMINHMVKKLNINDPLLDIAKELEQAALNDEYFVKRKLYPNVDFYSGILLWALGFPLSMYTAVFAVARTVGWVAHWKEMIEDPSRKISRPRQLYTGYKKRDYIDLDKRQKKNSIIKTISSIIKSRYQKS